MMKERAFFVETEPQYDVMVVEEDGEEYLRDPYVWGTSVGHVTQKLKEEGFTVIHIEDRSYERRDDGLGTPDGPAPDEDVEYPPDSAGW
jgi:hypothetical protein